jgi:hypothetical protein
VVDLHREPTVEERIVNVENGLAAISHGMEIFANALTAQADVLARLDQSNQTMIVAGKTSTRWESQGNPIAWVFTPPQPYADTTIVCAPDSSQGINARCYAQRKMPGGGQIRWPLILGEPEEIS